MKYLSYVDKYLTLKYKYKYKYSGHKYKYKYFEMVLEYYSSTSTSTKYYISAVKGDCFSQNDTKMNTVILMVESHSQ